MIRLSSSTRASTDVAEHLDDQLAAHQADDQNGQPDQQRAPADAEQFAQFAVGRFRALPEIIGEGFRDPRRVRPGRFLRRHFDHDGEERPARQFARPTDHEFFRVRIEIALAERRGIEGIEQLHDGAHVDGDFKARPRRRHYSVTITLPSVPRSTASCAAAMSASA